MLIMRTTGYVLIPPSSRACSMFTPVDFDDKQVKELTIADILLTASDAATLEECFRCLIWDVIKASARMRKMNFPLLEFNMPTVYQIDAADTPEILPLKTYNLNEEIIDQLIYI